MNLERRIRDELHDTAERLALDPGEYRRAMERGAIRRRRRWTLITSGVVGVAALVFAANALELGRAPQPVGSTPATTLASVPPATIAPVTTPSTISLGPGVAVASGEGVRVFSPDGGSTYLESDRYYEAISWAISDGEGGMIYTHEVTPLPWDQGTLLRLAAGATTPAVLAAPDGGGVITPLTVDEGSVFYRFDDLAGQSRVMAVDLDGSSNRQVAGPTPMMTAVAVDDGIVVVSLGGDCGGYELYRTDGIALGAPGWATECSRGVQNDIALASGFLFTLSDIDSERQLVRIDLATGDQVASAIDEGWQVEAESAARVAVGGPTIRVGDFSGNGFVETENYLGDDGTFALIPNLTMATGARLGSGMGELPCTPIDVPNPAPPADLPELVADKYLLLFTLAKDCELEQLGELVMADNAAFTFGGDFDPVRNWVRSARHGFDVMVMTVRILNSAPAEDAGIYAWPAVHITNREEDWSELSGVLTAAEYDQLYQHREDSGYLGLRVGIAEDGRLVYLIAGD